MPTPDPRSADALRAEYVARVNRVLDHIERNLDQPLSPAALADIAHFSRFHFHRIFAAMTGETLGQLIRRLRVERAAQMLLHNPEHTITAVAIDCGFSSPATFARSFKEAFGMSATQWREQGDSKACEADRKDRKALGNLSNALEISGCYIDPQTTHPTWRLTMSASMQPLNTKIEVRELSARHVVYLRHAGPYGQAALVRRLVDKLRSWAVPRGLLTGDAHFILVPHDSPNVTEQDKLRLSVCLTVPPGTDGSGEVGTMEIPGGKFAVARFEMRPERIAEAWGVVMGGWLPQSGFQPDDRLPYEEVIEDPTAHPEGKIILDICVPVRPL